MSTKKLTKSKKGFTIIEVVLVLAIAGLIFLMVFVALPALQRNQRDTQRRQDYADLAAAITASAANNNGTPRSYTSSGESINENVAKQLINKTGKDPQGNTYSGVIKIKPSGDQAAPTSVGTVNVYYKAQCDSSGSGKAKDGDSTKRQFVVQGYLEGGVYCSTYEY